MWTACSTIFFFLLFNNKQWQQYKERDAENNVLYHKKCSEVDELRQEVIAFGEENAKLRLNLDIANNSAKDLHDRLFEQQMAIQHLQKQSGILFMISLFLLSTGFYIRAYREF